MSRVSRIYFGFSLVVVGSVLLLNTHGVLTLGQMAFPVALTLIGLYLLYRAIFLDSIESTVFGGTFATLTGVFLILYRSAFATVAIERTWPVFMLIGGVALWTYAFRKGREYRIVLGVPASALMILSGVFFLFSLDIVEISFIDFAITWWPALLVFVGALIVWSYYRHRDEP